MKFDQGAVLHMQLFNIIFPIMLKKNIPENIGIIFANTQNITLELKTFCK